MEFLKNSICVTDHVFLSKFQDYKTRLPIIGIIKSQGTKVRKITGLEKKCVFFVKLRNTGANPINIIMPTPKFWSWRNYDKSLFQSYKAVFSTQKYAKRAFLGVNFNVKSYAQICARKLV
jgi:hypothetical protein